MEEFVKAYSIKEASEKLGVAEGTLRQWEADLAGVLYIARYKGSRVYTDFDIETLNRIKEMRKKNISKKMIREGLEKEKKHLGTEVSKSFLPAIPHLSQSEAIDSLQRIQKLPEEMEVMMTTILSNVKEELKKEIREEVRNEVIEEVRKELSNSSKNQQELLESGNDRTAIQIESLAKLIKEMKELQENATKKDFSSIENSREVDSPKQSFFKRLFKK